MITARHFKESEFRACTPSCSMQQMQQSTLSMLDEARDIAGIPFVLNCAYRSREWDRARGRDGNSAHTTGHAVDIRCTTGANRFKVVRALYEAGFRRIGIGRNYVHADNSPRHAQNVMWHYYE